jgi:hypothetical protein
MADTLHIVRTAHDTKALECIQAQAKQCDITLLLIGEGTKAMPPEQVRCYTLTDTTENRPTTAHEDSIEYDQFVQLLFGHDSIIVW